MLLFYLFLASSDDMVNHLKVLFPDKTDGELNVASCTSVDINDAIDSLACKPEKISKTSEDFCSSKLDQSFSDEIFP